MTIHVHGDLLYSPRQNYTLQAECKIHLDISNFFYHRLLLTTRPIYVYYPTQMPNRQSQINRNNFIKLYHSLQSIILLHIQTNNNNYTVVAGNCIITRGLFHTISWSFFPLKKREEALGGNLGSVNSSVRL